jgi:hypothetical protein
VDLHLFTYPTYETFDPDTAFFFYADHSMEFGSGSRDLMTKNWKNLQLENTAFFIFLIKLQFTGTFLYTSIKDVQATGEVFIPQKRTSST